MFSRFSGGRRVAPLAERRVAAQLREALAALPAPWVVLASRRASGADGPPWVRFLALHPEKGIALVDTEAAEGAVAPLEDFLARTGFPALQPGALPIVPVAVGAGEIGVVGDLLAAAFVPTRRTVGNPNWCEAVVELLLAAPDLMLAPLRRSARPPRPAAPELPLKQPTQRPVAPATPSESSRSQASSQSQPKPQPAPQSQSATRAEPVRLVPRQVAPEATPLGRPPRRQPPAEDIEVPLGLRRAPPPAEDANEPQLHFRAEPRFMLEADEPVVRLRQARASLGRHEPSFHTRRRRADARWSDTRAPRRRWPIVPIAAGVILAVAVGAIAIWYREGASPIMQAKGPPASLPQRTAALTPTPAPAPPQPSPREATPQLQPKPAATAPAPAPAPTPPPIEQAAKPPQPPPVVKTDTDLPRAMLQPQIAVPPPLPPPLPAAKLAAEPVRTAAAPKAEHTASPAHTAAAKPHSPPAASDEQLPAPIAAVLHPESAPPQPPSPTAVAPAPPVAETPATSAAPMATATATTNAAPPPGGTITVNGITYVKGEQPRSLGTLGSGSPSAPSAASQSPPAPPPAPAPALASNGPAAAVSDQPREVVISRAPAAPPAMTTTPPAGAPGAAASGPPREIVISRAPGSGVSNGPPAPAGAVPPSDVGSSGAIQVAPVPDDSRP